MKFSHQTEVVVVGGGPAGLAVAIELCSRGHEVLVLDKKRPPIDKPCGEGLMPDGVARLAEMGVELAPGEAARFNGIRYVDGSVRAEANFAQGFGVGVRRPVLQEALHARAVALGVTCGWETKVQGLTDKGVSTDSGEVAARWVVGADGLHSRVRQWAELSAPTKGTRRFGVRRHYSGAPWSDLVEVHWAERCEAYVTPVSGEEFGVALLWSGEKAGFDDLLERFPVLRQRLDGLQVAGRDLGTGPLEQRCVGVFRGRIALVGDAAGYRDAITGEGISVAFHQARALAEAISANDLSLYAGQARNLTRLPFTLIWLLLVAERRPWLRSRLVRTLAREPALFHRLLAIHARQRPPRHLGADGVARLARGLIAPS